MRRAGQLTRKVTALLLASLFVSVMPRHAAAGDKDTDAVVSIAEAMNDFVEGKYAEALKKLEGSLKACGKICAADTRSQLNFHIGVIQGLGEKNKDKARASFEAALRDTPKYAPDRQFMNRELDKLWAEAKVNIKKNGGAPPPAKAGPPKEQLDAAATAQGQLASRDWSGCMGTLIAAMASSEFALGKLILAKCQDTGDLILEATADAKLAAKLAEDEGNGDVASQAAVLIERLENDTPTITLQIPKGVNEITVTIDGVELEKDKIDKPIPHNPGKASIAVKGKRGSYPYAFKSTETMDRGEKISVNAEQGDGNTSAIQQCINNARTAADLAACSEGNGKRGLTFKSSPEIFVYNDTTQVNVFSPAATFSLENPTSGWSLGGAVVVDVVSTASPDIVATASRRFDQTRVGGSLGGSIKLGPAKIGLDGEISAESDYLARSIGVFGSTDLWDKRITPTLKYSIGFDVLSRGGTPNDVFSVDLLRHTIDGSVSVVVDPSTIAVGMATAQFELGDSSKPYRYVPMFAADTATRVPRGAVRALIEQTRQPVFPIEQLPSERSRFALGGRVAHRFETVTIRGDERIYIDTWGLKASTTDVRFFMDLTKELRLSAHGRFHIQGPADFWQRAYTATSTPTGWQLPKLRTGDRELGPLLSGWFGGGARYQATEWLGAGVQVEGIYTQFLDHVYVYDRLGVFAATTIDLEF